MKILHIGKYFPPYHGGIENFMSALMIEQQKEGHKVSAIVHHHENKQEFVQTQSKEGNIYRVPCYGQLAYAPISPSFPYYLNMVIEKETPDILHIHMPNLSAFWCLFLSAARKTPWVIQWQSDVLGTVPDLRIKLLYPGYRVFEKLLLNRARRVIVATPTYKASSIPLAKYANKTEVIPLALAEREIAVRNAKTKLICESTSTIKLLMVGRLTYYKGHKVIIKAIAKLKERGAKFTLYIVGDGELYPEIALQITELNLTENVKLLGSISDSDLNSILTEADLLCLPSVERTEAFGVVLLEAMRAEKACLVSDVPGSGMSWVVQDNKTGFVVKHNNVESIVGKLDFITKNPKCLRELGMEGRERFEQHFSIKSVNSAINQLYKSIMINDEKGIIDK